MTAWLIPKGLFTATTVRVLLGPDRHGVVRPPGGDLEPGGRFSRRSRSSARAKMLKATREARRTRNAFIGPSVQAFPPASAFWTASRTPTGRIGNTSRASVPDHGGVLQPLDQVPPDLEAGGRDQGQPEARQPGGQHRHREDGFPDPWGRLGNDGEQDDGLDMVGSTSWYPIRCPPHGHGRRR